MELGLLLFLEIRCYKKNLSAYSQVLGSDFLSLAKYSSVR